MAYLLLQGDALRIPLPDKSVDLCFGSPPYVDARLYLEHGRDLGISRGCAEWVEWMLAVTTEALRVSRGAVLWVAAGVTRDRTYWPACEGLMWEWWKRGGSAYRPCYWRRVGIPGSGQSDWFRSDVEYCMCFKHTGELAWADNTAMGKPPLFAAGGEMSGRLKNGRRLNDWTGKSDVNRKADGTRDKRLRPSHARYDAEGLIVNPGNLIDTGAAGGGNIGHVLAHENEAPFPEALAEWFIRSLCPPNGTCLDPFSGSGTTVAVAERLGRHGIGMDLRRSQAGLAARRIERPHCPVVKSGRVEHHPLFPERTP